MKSGGPSVTMTGPTLQLKWCADSLATSVWREARWSLVRAMGPSGWTMWAALETRAPSSSATTVALESTTVYTQKTLELSALVSYDMVCVSFHKVGLLCCTL